MMSYFTQINSNNLGFENIAKNKLLQFGFVHNQARYN